MKTKNSSVCSTTPKHFGHSRMEPNTVPRLADNACEKCGTACPGTQHYCDGCKVQCYEPTVKWANHASYAETKKKEPWARWYDLAVWRGKNGLRAKVLSMAKNAVCCICHRAAATIADHIKPHKGDWSLFTKLDNLQGACKACHDAKSTTEKVNRI
jgi:5-methylcytosine-specific restriction endonuclease McrA